MSQLFDIALQVQTALGVKFRPATESINKQTGLPQPVWGLLPTALSYEPEPTSVTELQKRNPYTAAPILDQQLDTLRRGGLVSVDPRKEYRLTDVGRARAQSILQTQRAYHATIQPLLETDMKRLAELLKRVVVAVDKAPTPPGTWCITRARRLRPADSAALTTHIDHYLSCLNAFRDDAHLAAWRPHSVSGTVWETFTLIWRGDAKNAEELSQKLAFRGHTRETYGDALSQLSEKGWVAENASGYAVTTTGKALRDAAEMATDKYFDGAYSLPDANSHELRGLLEKLHGALTK